MERSVEFGRSVLEVIIILSLSALLVFGGLYFWKSADVKGRAQAVIRHAIAMKSARQLTMSSHSNQPLLRSEKGPYDIVLTIQNGIVAQNKDFFWISIVASNPDFRDALIQAGRNNLLPCMVTNSDTEITFYFPKFKADILINEKNAPNKDLESN